MLLVILVQSVLLIVIGTAKSSKIHQTQPPVIEEPIVVPNDPPEKPPEILKDFTSYDEALKASKTYNRPIFLFFKAEWCGWCHKMKNETLSDAEVKDKLSKEYIVCIIDTDKDKVTTRKYQILGIPVSLVINSSETVLLKTSGNMPKKEFLDWLKSVSYVKNVSFIKD